MGSGSSRAITTLYLHIFDWPSDGKLPLAISNKVRSCRLLSDPAVTFETNPTAGGLEIQLTGSAPDLIASVIELEIEGTTSPSP